MDYRDFKNSPTRAASDKVIHDKVFNIAKNPKYDGFQRGLSWNVINFLLESLVVLLKAKLCRTKN